MNSVISALAAMSIKLAAPRVGCRPSMKSSVVSPYRSIVIWHGCSRTPTSRAISINSVTLATLCSLASILIIDVPIPPKLILPSFRWSVPPRSISDSPFCIQFLPVIRLSLRWSTRSPQKVKKTSTSRPDAAPVVARIMTGQTRSRALLQQMIAMRLASSSSVVVVSAVVSVFSIAHLSLVGAGHSAHRKHRMFCSSISARYRSNAAGPSIRWWRSPARAVGRTRAIQPDRFADPVLARPLTVLRPAGHPDPPAACSAAERVQPVPWHLHQVAAERAENLPRRCGQAVMPGQVTGVVVGHPKAERLDRDGSVAEQPLKQLRVVDDRLVQAEGRILVA